MKTALALVALSAFAVINTDSVHCQTLPYSWLDIYDSTETMVNRIPALEGYERPNVTPNSFEDWLRLLPLKKDRPQVYLYNGKRKSDQDAHFAVIDIDIGDKDLQQCADAIIRLRAEYLYSIKDYDSIHFNFTSGDKASFRKWIEGYRPTVHGKQGQVG